MNDYVIIVAGGRGTRMGTDEPKQFLPIGGKPVLMRTIERFHAYDARLGIIVVLPRDQQDHWRQLCADYHFTIAHQIADGGASRFESSRSGLRLIAGDDDGVVAFHDGVRPFVSIDVIARCFALARRVGAVVPVVPVTDTLRHIDGDNGHTTTVDRRLYRAVQTPQAFSIALARKAFAQPPSETFTDDASVVESLGVDVSITEGNRENIKLTTPFDLKLAELLIEQK